jgi:hypothetical protein
MLKLRDEHWKSPNGDVGKVLRLERHGVEELHPYPCAALGVIVADGAKFWTVDVFEHMLLREELIGYDGVAQTRVRVAKDGKKGSRWYYDFPHVERCKWCDAELDAVGVRMISDRI